MKKSNTMIIIVFTLISIAIISCSGDSKDTSEVIASNDENPTETVNSNLAEDESFKNCFYTEKLIDSNGNNIIDSVKQYQYNEKGILLKESTDDNNDGLVDHEELYQYREDGKKTYEHIKVYAHPSFLYEDVIIYQARYEYEANEYYHSIRKVSNDGIEMTYYDSNNNKLEYLKYGNGLEIFESRDYDTSGKKLKTYRHLNGSEYPNIIYHHHYDENGQEIETRIDNDGDGVVDTTRNLAEDSTPSFTKTESKVSENETKIVFKDIESSESSIFKIEYKKHNDSGDIIEYKRYLGDHEKLELHETYNNYICFNQN